MAKNVPQGFSDRQVAHYTDSYYERADLVFRFGALLTVSREGGERIVEETFQHVVEQFSTISEQQDPVLLLMAQAWKSWKKLKTDRFHEWNNPIVQSMKPLKVEHRAVLFASELAGLELKDIGSIFGMDESAVRYSLGQANQFLAKSNIRV